MTTIFFLCRYGMNVTTEYSVASYQISFARKVPRYMSVYYSR